MLTLVVLWVALGLLCAGAGLALMGPAAALFVRAWDRLLFASFLGLVAIGAALLAWSLVAPVTPLALIVCAALALAGLWGVDRRLGGAVFVLATLAVSIAGSLVVVMRRAPRS